MDQFINDHIIKLKDGRKLGFAEYGDSKGKPLFFFHGWPSSRIGGKRYENAAKKLGVRIISIDRPGYGLSDFKADRTLLDFPSDVLEVAKHLKIRKFAILGASGGGPYAVVCAFKIPEMISKAGIVVGLGPTNIKGLLDGMSFLGKFSWSSYRIFPPLRYFATFLAWFETKVLSSNSYSLLISKPDRLLMTNSFKQLTRQSKVEAFKHGFRGVCLDLKIYSENWGFDLIDIKLPVYLWYGDGDKSVSVNMGKYLSSQIPNSKLKIYPNEGHYLHVNHAEEILQQLI